MASLPKPLNVSPLIKAARWTFFISGVMYGVNKKNFFIMLEKTEKIKRAERIQRRHEESIVENKKIFDDLVLEFANELRLDIPPGWKPSD